MAHSIDAHSDHAQAAAIERLFELARTGQADAAELDALDAQLQAGLAAAYGESMSA